MAKALRHSEVRGHREAHKPVEWTKRMSDHIAAALLIYTALHIIDPALLRPGPPRRGD